MSLLKDMSVELKIDEDFILTVAKRAKYYYRHFTIPKKNGGRRNIFHPSPILKTFQYWLVINVFNKFPISDYSYSYKKGSSIKNNAKAHCNSNFFLHIDIRNFFESISKEHLLKVFETNSNITKILNLSQSDLQLINDICFFNERLTIGSVSSPVISNIIMYNFDKLIAREVSPLIYTRYADDLMFSSNNFIDYENINIIKCILEKNGFEINNNKTRFMSKKHRQTVTGLIVNKGKVTVGLNNKKMIKSMVYNKLKYGVGDSNKILGHLFFLKDIEPDYFNKIIIKYSYFGNVLDLIKEPKGKKEAAPTKE